MADSSQKESVTVRIGGEDHTIRANVEPEYTRRCAKWVDDRIAEIRGQLGLIESHKAAILAALSITDELFQAQAEVDDLKDSTSSKVEALATRLEAVLVEEAEEVKELDPPPSDPEPQLALGEPPGTEGQDSGGGDGKEGK
jgi:cell division protein ZapA